MKKSKLKLLGSTSLLKEYRQGGYAPLRVRRAQ
jgi:hypothetical protein